ncbi:MAG: aminotransferase class V-fold PLP-dependent enzyme [Acidobacteriota bacterium]
MPRPMPRPERAVDRRRDDFPALAGKIHLLSHSLGPVPRTARESMLSYLRRWERHTGEDAWATGWWDISRDVGDRIARIIGAAPGTVQVQPSTSVALSAVISCLDFGAAKRRVVTSALDFPTTGYIWEAQRRLGAEVHVVPSDDGIAVPTERILEAIDSATCMVALSHVSYLSSYRVDAAAVIERAHRMGALVLLDVYQSAGVLEMDAAGLGVDFLIGGTIKWLCGGPACGYLYVRPDRIRQLEPRLTGWIAHEEPFAFSHGPIRYAASVRRFAQGTPNIPGLHSCLPGLKLVEETGLATIAAESRRRTEWMVDFALERGWPLSCPRDAARRGGSVMIGVERPAEMVDRLAARGVFVDWRPRVGLRMSPHFFNTDDEVERAMRILSGLMG